MRSRLIPVLLSALAGACSEKQGFVETGFLPIDSTAIVQVPARDTAAVIQTDSLVLHMRHQGIIYSPSSLFGFRFRNTTAGRISIVNCNGITGSILEKRVGDQWVFALGGVVPACLSPAIVVDAGAAYHTAIDLTGADPGYKTEPSFAMVPVPGIYRLAWEVDTGAGTAVASWPRSNAFAIVVDP